MIPPVYCTDIMQGVDQKMRTNIIADTYQTFFQQKTVSVWKNCGFLDCLLGTKVITLIMWMIKITTKANQIDIDGFAFSKVDNEHTKTMFVSKVRVYPLIYWFVNFTLTDKHGTKNL